MRSKICLSRRRALQWGISGLLTSTVIVAPVLGPFASANDGFIEQTLTLPPAKRTVNVSNQSQFGAAIANAVAGDHIVLANGSYSGGGTWTKSGTQAAPIVIRSANLLGARITGSLDPNGSDLILYGLDFPNAFCRVGQFTQSNRVRIWRCRWRDRSSGTSIALRTDRTDGLEIAYCEWVNWAGRGIATGIANGTRNYTIRRCLFRDAPNQRSSNGVQLNATEALQLGFADNDAAIISNGRVEYNRFQHWNSDDEVVAIKTSGTVIFRNTMENCWGSISNRSGRNNLYEANRIVSSGGFWNFDGPNFYLGNQQTGNHPSFSTSNNIFAGNRPAGSYPMPHQSSGMNNSVNCVFSGNNFAGPLIIGYKPSWVGGSLVAQNNRIRQHSGTVSLSQQSGTSSQPGSNETQYSWSAPIYLTNNDVGPHANGIDNVNQPSEPTSNQSPESNAGTSQQQSESQQSSGSSTDPSQEQQSQNVEGTQNNNSSNGCVVDSSSNLPNSTVNNGINQCVGDIDAIIQQHQGESGWDVAVSYRRKAHDYFLEMSKYPVGSVKYNEYRIYYEACDAIHHRAREIATLTGIIK